MIRDRSGKPFSTDRSETGTLEMIRSCNVFESLIGDRSLTAVWPRFRYLSGILLSGDRSFNWVTLYKPNSVIGISRSGDRFVTADPARSSTSIAIPWSGDTSEIRGH